MTAKSRFPLLVLLATFAAATAAAQSPAPATARRVTEPGEPIRLDPYRVEAEAEADHYIQGPFLPDVQGTKINVGKKTSILDLDSLPRITGNNYRQALSQAPGLVLSEETSPLISIGYRGLEPHRAQFMQVLKDGIPIHADQFGYPEAYYSPPLDTVDRIEFVRGGAALMYGPQPGGALNYVTHRPRTDKAIAGSTLHTFGSDDYYSSFSYLDGTLDRVGYYGYYNHRESDGIRTSNSDYELDAWLGRVVLDANSASRWVLTLETYEEEHGEAGGLTFAPGATAVNYNTHRETPSRLFDRFNLDRKAVSLIWERDFTRGTFSARAWAVDYVRASRRQGGGGFGTLPTGAAAATNTIERQQFTTLGAEARVRIDWGSDNRNVFTAGTQVFTTDSPRTDSRGSSPTATSGIVQTKSQRDIAAAPVFVENLFRFGALSITPGVRLETFKQEVAEEVNVAKAASGNTLAHDEDTHTVPLFGLALAYDLPAQAQLYANVSQSYRPMIFTQAVPNGATNVVNRDLEESHAIQYELGWRAQPMKSLVLDASVFYLEFDDQIGTTALPGGLSSVGNVGRSVHRGVEVSANYNVMPLILGDETTHRLEFYANALLLDAELKQGANAGKAPQYAADHLIRTGLIYAHTDELKLALTGTLSDDSFADDANTSTRYIPAHAVWDFTAEYRIPHTPVRVIGGVNNVFDEDYYNRIRPDGIDPAPGRNYYLGAALEF